MPRPYGPAPKRPSNQRLAWIIAGVLGISAAIAGTALALAATNHHHRASPTTGTSSYEGPTAPTSTQETFPTQTASETAASTDTAETHPPSTAAPSPYAGNAVVSVAPAAARNPLAPTVVRMLTRYFEDINNRNFDDYRLLFAQQLRANLDPQQLAIGYRSTTASNAQLMTVTVASDGRPAATATFTSQQDAADGPNGETCTHWTVMFYLQPEGNRTVFGPHPSGYQAEHAAC